MRKPQTEQIDAGNALAARIILADPEKYDGLPVQWARLWQSRHANSGIIARDTSPKTIEERLAAHDAKQRKKRLAKRRERWGQRQWRISRKGNRYVNVNDFHIVVFRREDGWKIRIHDKHSEESRFSQKAYGTREAAMAGAFDALLAMESRRTLLVPELAWRERRTA